MNREDRRKLERAGGRVEGIPLRGVKRVGRRLPGVQIGSLADRQGVALGSQVDEVVRQVTAQQQALPEGAGHVPAIGALHTPGHWGVFCLRCSGEAQDYVYPCKVDPSDWPPQVLIEPPQAVSEDHPSE